MRNKRHLVLVLALLVLGLVSVMFMAACGEEATTTTTAAGGTETTAAPSGGTTTTGEAAGGGEFGEDIVIGMIASLTGPNALGGLEHKWAYETAIADINAKGGVKLNDGKGHKLVVKVADDESEPAKAAAAAERLIKTDGVKIILSTNNTPLNEAAATVCEQYEVFYQCNTAWIDDGVNSPLAFIGSMNLKWTADIMEECYQAGRTPVGAALTMPKEEQPTKWGLFVENTPDGDGIGGSMKYWIEDAGWEVVAFEKFVEGTPDFSSIIMKFKQAGVEATGTLIAPADAITWVRQCKEANWAPKLMFGYKGYWPADFANTLGPDSEYICNDAFWASQIDNPGAKELQERFMADHDGRDSVTVGMPYSTVQILATAMEQAGDFPVDHAKVRDQVFGGTFEGTVMGTVTYGNIYPDLPGISHNPFKALQWIGGKRVVVYPKELATGQIQAMKPWDQR